MSNPTMPEGKTLVASSRLALAEAVRLLNSFVKLENEKSATEFEYVLE